MSARPVALLLCTFTTLQLCAHRTEGASPRCGVIKSIDAVGKAEASALRCVARTVAKNRPERALGDCRLNVDARFDAAMARAGDCTGLLHACRTVLDACATAVREALP